MVEMSATVDGAASRAFEAALKELSDSLGKQSASAPRRAAIQMCKSFRAATKMAKRKRPVQVIKLERGQTDMPLWVTWDRKKGGPLNPAKRLFKVNFPQRNFSTMRYYGIDGAVTSAQIAKAKEKELGRLYTFKEKPTGTRGLAKRSWGWVMHNIFKGAAPDTPWVRRKGDKRSPKDATSESMSSESVGALVSSGCARISNRLDYIRDALTKSDDEIISKAANILYATLSVRRLRKSMAGHSSDEIKAAARELAHDFKQRFQD